MGNSVCRGKTVFLDRTRIKSVQNSSVGRENSEDQKVVPQLADGRPRRSQNQPVNAQNWRSQSQATNAGNRRSQTQPAELGALRCQTQPADAGTLRSQTQPAEAGTPRSQTEPVKARTLRSQTQPTEEGTPRSQTEPVEARALRSQTQPAKAGTLRSQTEPVKARTLRSQTQPAEEGTLRSQTQPAGVGTLRSQTEPVEATALRSQTQPAEAGTLRSQTEPVKARTLRSQTQPAEEGTLRSQTQPAGVGTLGSQTQPIDSGIPASRPREKDGTGAVEGLLSQSKVVIFTMTTCSRCTQVKDILTLRGVPYTAAELDQRGDGQEIQQGLQQLVQQRDVPLVFVNGQFIGGLERVEQAQRDGTLGELVMDPETYDYDLVVIGSEPGGLAAAKEAASYGKRVMVLDPVTPAPEGPTWAPGLGGASGHVTCASRKLMQQAALLGQAVRDSRKFGWEREEQVSHRWSHMTEVLRQRIGTCRGSQALRDARVLYLRGSVKLVGPHTVKVTDVTGNDTRRSAATFVIATGGRARYLGIPGDKEHCITSDHLLRLPHCPGRTLVVGASRVGLECAGFLCGLGLDVTVMVRSVLLRGLDRKMAQKLENHMLVHGVNFLHCFTPTKVEQVQEGSPGRLRVTAMSTEGAQTYEGEFNTVLLAVGRDPCTLSIGLDCVGVKYDQRTGKIPVEEDDRTNVGHIFALGEAQEGRPGVGLGAVRAGRLLARRLYGGRSAKFDYTNIPIAVFTPMEYGACGLSEEAAIHKYGEDNVEVYHTYYWPLEWTLPGRDKNSCYAKVICHIPDSERVVGVHVLGPSAGEIVQGFAVALGCGMTKQQLDATIGIHPVCAEVLTTLTVTQRASDALTIRGNC